MDNKEVIAGFHDLGREIAMLGNIFNDKKGEHSMLEQKEWITQLKEMEIKLKRLKEIGQMYFLSREHKRTRSL